MLTNFMARSILKTGFHMDKSENTGFFKNRNTVARKHVVGRIVRAPCGNTAMIVRSPHGFYDNFGTEIVR